MRLFLFLLFWFQFHLSIAQENKFGIKVGAGLSESTYTNSDIFGGIPIQELAEPIFSFGFNAMLDFPLATNISLVAEPGVITKGDTFDEPVSRFNQVRLIQYHLQLPTLLRWKIRQLIYVDAGIETSYLMRHRVASDEPRFGDAMKSTFELTALVGLAIPVDENILLGLRYGRGLTSIAEDEIEGFNGNISGQGEMKNRYVHFFFGYFI